MGSIETTGGPDWDALYARAEAQAGFFSTADASAAGYSSPLLVKHVAGGRFRRVRRGVYRLVHFPPTEHEELVVVWLWTERAGVFSHTTALALLDLSDVLPTRIEITVPAAWRRRRLRIPPGVVLRYADLATEEREWHEFFPVTTPRRTLQDCVAGEVSPELVSQAIAQARERGLVSRQVADELSRCLENRLGGAR